ncbi:MAG: SDR family oxidoreductase [Candidatus Omnitrophica bacterium]|nr:SDR family oxidoreductase [Candidatus Omnitrophota bacterium]
MPKNNRTQKVALVTGGAKRIGEAVCRALARSGYSIALHYSTSGVEAEQAAKRIYKEGGVCATFACDLADAHATEDLVPCVLEEFGRLDALVNSASIFEKSTLAEGSLDVWDRHFAVNLKAPYVLMRSFAHYAKQGSIVNILDTHVSRSKTTYAAYLLSKKTLGELTKMAAVEFAPRIRVNAVAPGIILPPASQKSGYLDRLVRQVPLQRKGSVENIAHAVLFLLENDYVTGQVIFEDGGEHLI